MAKSKLTWLTTEAAAAETGISRTSVWRACRDNPGFAVKLGGTYRIPPEHLARVIKGETPAQIAAEVRSGMALTAPRDVYDNGVGPAVGRYDPNLLTFDTIGPVAVFCRMLRQGGAA